MKKKREWLAIPDKLREQVAIGAASADEMIVDLFGNEDDDEDVKELRDFIQVQSENISDMLERVSS